LFGAFTNKNRDLEKGLSGITFTNGNNTQKYITTNTNKNEIADHHHEIYLPEISKKDASHNIYALNLFPVTESLLGLERKYLLHKTTSHYPNITKYVYLNHSPLPRT
jgi:hypothetical protein